MNSAAESQFKHEANVQVRFQALGCQEPTSAPLLHNAMHCPALKSWPNLPHRVKRSWFTTIWSLAVDIALMAWSVAFFAFALIVNYYDKAPVAEHKTATDRLTSASKYGPTVFPILFAAVISRATYAILLWRLERGERIGVLDTLAGSTSLTSTIISQLRLRIVSLLGLSLLTIWLLSPLGGQASFRQLSLGVQDTVSQASYTYMAPTSSMYAYGDSGRGAVYGIVDALFNAAIMCPFSTKISPLDLWGNLKVPRIEYLEGRSSADSNGWFDTNLDTSVVSDVYVSLAGLPITGLEGKPYTGDSMRLQTTYLNLTCQNENGGYSISEHYPRNSTSTVSGESNSASLSWPNATAGIPGGEYWPQKPYRTNESYQQNSPEALFFAYSVNWLNFPLSVGCFVRQSYVEVEVLCPRSTNCRVMKIRRSQLPHVSPNVTYLDGYSHTWTWNLVASPFINSVTSRNTYPSLIDFFIATPDNPSISRNWTTLQRPAEIYSIRLGQLLNTYWMLAVAPYTISGGLTNTTSFTSANTSWNLTDYSVNYTSLTQAGIPDSAVRAWTTTGTRHTTTEVIQAHRPWIVALAAASTVLIIASLIPLIMRHLLTRNPDVLMNISSLATRNNPHIPLPPSGTYLDASDRARLLRDYKVRFGDVDATADVGVLAISALDKDGTNDIRVRKSRTFE